MHLFDWILVGVLNGAIILYGLIRSRETRSSADWFLAGRSLPWWMVGLSLYATAIDSADLVAVSGATYILGIRLFVINWMGVMIGWVSAAHFIILPMYRAGMYTNAEYLEARFGVAARVCSTLVQVQNRTLVLGLIATAIYLVLAIVCDWGPHAWWAVVAMALVATIYTALGGLKSVAVTDALQTILMLIGSGILFCVVWSNVGGWTGLEEKLAAHQRDLPDQMLHIGHDTVQVKNVQGKSAVEIERLLLVGGEYDEREQQIVVRTPAWLVCIALAIVGFGYPIVNHTQSMRMFGARSEWDLKMSVIVSGALLLATTFTIMMIGVMGRAIHPVISEMPLDAALQTRDSIYPLLVRDLTSCGLKGLVVAGAVAAFFSTCDSIGATLSSLLVRDVYARLIVRDREDQHYLRVGQWLTPLIIFGSFGYVPLLIRERGMMLFLIDQVSVFVVPLLTIYLMGVLTRVHRSSGAIGLLIGVAYGVLRLLAPMVAERFAVVVLPPLMVNAYASYVFSILITAGTMIATSLLLGWETPGELLHQERTGWLRASQLRVSQIDPTGHVSRSPAWPVVLGIALVVVGALLSLVIFW